MCDVFLKYNGTVEELNDWFTERKLSVNVNKTLLQCFGHRSGDSCAKNSCVN